MNEEMKYEIHIGEICDWETGIKKPRQVIIISETEKRTLESFADTRKDQDLNTIYRINDINFKIFPKIYS